jgi:predicted enzyme related to lactoylglutathione lyase
MKIKKATALHIVKDIEPALALYEKLGFKKTVEVPHGKKLGFVILAGKDAELMLQSQASLADDAADVAKRAGTHLLYCDVDSLDEARAAVKASKGCEILVNERTTPYGAKELWFVDPAGHVVGLAENA